MSARVRIRMNSGAWRTNVDLKTSGITGTILEVRGADSTFPEAFIFTDQCISNPWGSVINTLWVPFWYLEHIE